MQTNGQSAALTVVDVTPQAIAVADAWTPGELREMTKREGELRQVVLEYYRSQMREGHHYYTIGDGEGKGKGKPALSKEGALNLCSLFKCTPSVEVEEHYTPDGHLAARARCVLTSNRTGAIVANGDGSCTTRESKYAYRWCWPSEVPVELDKTTIAARERWTKNGKTLQYKCPNPDLADSYNTVLKMASKRALVDAACKLPLVSELFTQDLEEQIETATSKKETENRTRRGSTSKAAGAAMVTDAQRDTLGKLALAELLPDDVAKWIAQELQRRDLTEERAAEVIARAQAKLDDAEEAAAVKADLAGDELPI
jgi:hypothetical protein